MSGRRATVLVGFADALAAPEVAASLLAAGYGVSAFARDGRPGALAHMRGVQNLPVSAPERDLAACVAEVRALAGGHDAVMPMDDAAILVCEEALPAQARLAGPRGAQAELALDKRVQLRSAQTAGLRVPAWRAQDPIAGPAAGSESGEAILDRLDEGHGYPLMLKPALAAVQLGNRLWRPSPRLVADRRELERALAEWAQMPVIAQRWVQGTGVGVFGLAERGRIHHLSAHRRVRMMNPAGSGSSACRSAPVPAALREPIARMLEHARWSGMFMVELLEGEDGWWFMELNGRPWGSLALARRAGFEYPAWALAQLLDPDAELPPEPPFAPLLCRHLGREIVHLMFVLRGPRGYPGPWPTRAGTLAALLRPRAHTAWYNRGPGLRGVFLRDSWSTVRDQLAGARR